MTCISCVAIAPYEAQAFSYADQVFRVLAPSCKNALLAGIISLVAWELLVKGVIKSDLDLRDLAHKLAIGFFFYALLETQGMFLEYVIEPIKSSTVHIAQVIIEQSNFIEVEQTSSIAAINEALEKAIWKIFGYSENLFSRGGWFKPSAYLDGFLLCFPLLCAWCYFAFISIWFALVMAAVYAISPVLILFAIFPATRSLLLGGVKIVLQGSFRLFFALLFIGLCIASIQSFCEHNWFTGAQQNNSALIFTGSFLACFLNGVVTCKLLNYTNSLAATLIGGLHHVPSTSLNLASKMGNVLQNILPPKVSSPRWTSSNSPGQINHKSWGAGGIEKTGRTDYNKEITPSTAAALIPVSSAGVFHHNSQHGSTQSRTSNNAVIKPTDTVNSQTQEKNTATRQQPITEIGGTARAAANMQYTNTRIPQTNPYSGARPAASISAGNTNASKGAFTYAEFQEMLSSELNIGTGKYTIRDNPNNAIPGGMSYEEFQKMDGNTLSSETYLDTDTDKIRTTQATSHVPNSSSISHKPSHPNATQSKVERSKQFTKPLIEKAKTYYPATEEEK